MEGSVAHGLREFRMGGALKTNFLRGALMVAGMVAGMVALTAVFQNCGPLLPGRGVAEKLGIGAMSSYVSGADIAWSNLDKQPDYNRFGRAQRWGDVQGAGVNLYPPLIPNSQTLNLDASGTRVSKAGLEYVNLSADASMAPAVADLSEFVFDRTTVLLVVRDIEIPTEDPNKLVRLLSLFPANGDAAGVLVIDVAAAASGGLEFFAYQWFDGNTYSLKKLEVPASDLAGPIAVAARFDKAAASLQIAINGRLSQTELVTVGDVPPLGLVARSFMLHSPASTYGSGGAFNVGEVAIYKSAKTDAELASISRQLVRIWSSDNAIDPGSDGGPIATPTPIDSTGAQLYSSNCASCHGTLAASTKKGRTLDQLNNAINTVSSMSGLAGLSQTERESIIDALK